MSPARRWSAARTVTPSALPQPPPAPARVSRHVARRQAGLVTGWQRAGWGMRARAHERRGRKVTRRVVWCCQGAGPCRLTAQGRQHDAIVGKPLAHVSPRHQSMMVAELLLRPRLHPVHLHLICCRAGVGQHLGERGDARVLERGIACPRPLRDMRIRGTGNAD